MHRMSSVQTLPTWSLAASCCVLERCGVANPLWRQLVRILQLQQLQQLQWLIGSSSATPYQNAAALLELICSLLCHLAGLGWGLRERAAPAMFSTLNLLLVALGPTYCGRAVDDTRANGLTRLVGHSGFPEVRSGGHTASRQIGFSINTFSIIDFHHMCFSYSLVCDEKMAQHDLALFLYFL